MHKCVCVCERDLVGEVELVGVVDQSTSEPEAQLTFQESDGAVDEGGRNRHQEPLGELQDEGLRILLNDALHDHACKTTVRAQRRHRHARASEQTQTNRPEQPRKWTRRSWTSG